MTVPLRAHGQRICPVPDRRDGQVGGERRERLVERRQELQQLAQARDAVVGGQEVREEEAAARRAREDDAVAGRRRGERGERRGRALDLEAGPVDERRRRGS